MCRWICPSYLNNMQLTCATSFRGAFPNIEKYADAHTDTLSMSTSDDTLTLDIADDGAGFDLETAELGRGYRLPNIKDRAERLGGMRLIESVLG